MDCAWDSVNLYLHVLCRVVYGQKNLNAVESLCISANYRLTFKCIRSVKYHTRSVL